MANSRGYSGALGGTATLPGAPHRYHHLLPGSSTVGVTSCHLNPGPGSVKLARDHARRAVQRWNMPRLLDDVGLVVSELVTNALRHGSPTGGPVTLILLRKQPNLLCIVTDPGGSMPMTRQPTIADENGRGLLVVEACSRQWGWDTLDHGGKAVWALFQAGGA